MGCSGPQLRASVWKRQEEGEGLAREGGASSFLMPKGGDEERKKERETREDRVRGDFEWQVLGRGRKRGAAGLVFPCNCRPHKGEESEHMTPFNGVTNVSHCVLQLHCG